MQPLKGARLKPCHLHSAWQFNCFSAASVRQGSAMIHPQHALISIVMFMCAGSGEGWFAEDVGRALCSERNKTISTA